MQAAMPFYDSAEEATKAAIIQSGHTLKEVAISLWPDKSPSAAHTALANALNENRAERLTADQHLFIANYCGRYDFVHYVCHRTSHELPRLVTPERRQRELQAQLLDQARTLRRLLDEIERIGDG